MFWTLLTLSLLVVTGGFISYYGDLQGRRWGKRRVSWFGLRPKHTAIVITSLTGAAIAFLSVLAVMIVAPSVRDVVLRGEAAINDNRRINEEAARKVDAAQVQLKLKYAELAAKDATLQSLDEQLAKATRDHDALKAVNADLDKQNGGLVDGIMDLQRKRASLVRTIEKIQHELAVQKKELANAGIINADLGRQNSNLSRENTELAGERSRFLSENAGLRETNGKLKADNAKLESSNALLTMQYNAANKAYTGILDSNAAAKAQLDEMTQQLQDLAQQRDDLKSTLAGTNRDFVRAYVSLRQTRYNLRADTELARRTLDAHMSPTEAKDEVMGLLKDASDRARQYGAITGENGRCVLIVPKRVVTPASVTMADESASVSAIVDQVAGSNTPVVIVARAINNSAANEQVLVELTPYTSTIVFKAGEAVASREIDSQQPMDQLVSAVISFLKEDVRNAAIKSRTIPQISPETGEEEVGAIDTPELVTLVDRIRRTGGRVRLTAVANQTLMSADLLTFGQTRGGAKPHNLRFDLVRVGGKSKSKSEPLSD